MPIDLLDQMNASTGSGKVDLLDQQASIQASQPHNIGGFWPRVGADALAGAAQFSQGVANTPYNIAKYFGASPNTLSHLPAPINEDWSAYFGVEKPNILDKFAQGAASYAPAAVAGGASVLGQIIAAAAYGATQSENPVRGFAMGGLLGAAGAAIPGLGNALKSSIEYIKPGKYTNTLMDYLSGGASPQENAKILATQIQNAAAKQKGVANDLYNNFFNNLPSSSVRNGGEVSQVSGSIYPGAEISPTGSPVGNVAKLPFDAVDAVSKASYNSRALFQDFLNNPTVENAHRAQAQLGADIRRFQSKNLTMGDYLNLDELSAVQEAIQTDLESYLNTLSPEISNQYIAASQNYLNNYIPYKENRQIQSIVRGKNVNPDNITNIFSSPEPGTTKIVEDLGDEAKNRILFDALKKYGNDPDKLLAAFDNLKNRGLDNYITPQVNKMFDSLRSRIGTRDLTQRAAGLLLGAKILHPFSSAIGGADLLGAAGGATIAPSVIKGLQARFPLATLGHVLGSGISGLYNTAKMGILPNLIQGQ